VWITDVALQTLMCTAVMMPYFVTVSRQVSRTIFASLGLERVRSRLCLGGYRSRSQRIVL